MSISNSTTVWQIRSIAHELSFDFALQRLKILAELSRAKQDDLTEKMEKPDKMQACQRGLLETACNSWLSLSYKSHPKDLQDIIIHNQCTILEPRSVASSVFEPHQLQLKAKAMISQLALAA